MKKFNPIRLQKGQGMTEYILMVALIAVAVVGAVKFFGHKTGESFNQAATDVSGAVNQAKTDSSNNGSSYGK